MERRVQHFHHIKIAAEPRGHHNGAVRPRLEHDPDVVGFCNGLKQSKPRTDVGPATNLDVPHSKVIAGVHCCEPIGVDAVRSDEFGGFARERVGLVRVRRRFGFVQKLADPNQQVTVGIHAHRIAPFTAE